MFMPLVAAWAAGEGLTGKEEEHPISHGAQHGGEALANDKGEEHVAGHIDSRSSRASLEGLDLTAQHTNKGFWT
jgi:hypothetical protein